MVVSDAVEPFYLTGTDNSGPRSTGSKFIYEAFNETEQLMLTYCEWLLPRGVGY